SGKYAFWVPVSLMRTSISPCIRSHSPYPYGRMTMVPRTGPLSASSALLIRSWYQRGKSSARGVRTGAFAMARWYGGTSARRESICHAGWRGRTDGSQGVLRTPWTPRRARSYLAYGGLGGSTSAHHGG